jgi:hypothetical protein
MRKEKMIVKNMPAFNCVKMSTVDMDEKSPNMGMNLSSGRALQGTESSPPVFWASAPSESDE